MLSYELTPGIKSKTYRVLENGIEIVRNLSRKAADLFTSRINLVKDNNRVEKPDTSLCESISIRQSSALVDPTATSVDDRDPSATEQSVATYCASHLEKYRASVRDKLTQKRREVAARKTSRTENQAVSLEFPRWIQNINNDVGIGIGLAHQLAREQGQLAKEQGQLAKEQGQIAREVIAIARAAISVADFLNGTNVGNVNSGGSTRVTGSNPTPITIDVKSSLCQDNLILAQH